MTSASAGDGRLLEWQSLTGLRIAALDRTRTVVAVTCSPLEVHGPHLPTLADVGEAEGLFARAFQRLLDRHPELVVVRLPPLFTAADVLPHVGSLRFSPSVVSAVLEELGTTLARQGFRHVWVGNFHAGPRHILAIERACDRVNRRHDARMISVFSLLARRIAPSGDLSERLGGVGGLSRDDLKGDQHAGLVETSLLLRLHGALVDPAFTELPAASVERELEAAGARPLQRGRVMTFLELLRALPLQARYYARETYAGIPAGASAELGELYLDVLGREAAEALSDIWTGKASLAEARSPLWPLRHLLLREGLGRLFDRLVLGRTSPI